MSLLTIVQDVCSLLALPTPNAVVTSSDPQILQLLALSNTEGADLAARFTWQALQNEATFTSVATENQGAIATLAPGLKFVLNDTMWDRSQNRYIYGSLSPSRWQQLKSTNITGPYCEYRIIGGQLKFIPAPSAGHTIAFEYASKNWCSDSTGVTLNSRWSADSDIGVLPEDLMTLGLRWRFLRQKGMDYAEEFQHYERQVADAISRDTSKPVLNLGRPRFYRNPNGMEGSWNVS